MTISAECTPFLQLLLSTAEIELYGGVSGTKSHIARAEMYHMLIKLA